MYLAITLIISGKKDWIYYHTVYPIDELLGNKLKLGGVASASRRKWNRRKEESIPTVKVTLVISSSPQN